MPITISRLPWTCHLNPDGTTSLRSEDGKALALFADGRDADYVMSLFDTIESLKKEVAEAQADAEGATAAADKQQEKDDKIISDLREQLSTLNEQISDLKTERNELLNRISCLTS